LSASASRNTVFGNSITASQARKIDRWEQRFNGIFGRDPDNQYSLGLVENEQLGPIFGVKNIVRSGEAELIDPEHAVVCATTRAGYGLYRGAIAIISCAHSLGLRPYWLDLTAIQGISQDISKWRNNRSSRLSRLSQRSKYFNRYIWEPYTSGSPTLPGLSSIFDMLPALWSWKHIKGNLRDTRSSALMANLYAALPPDLPVISTYPWNAQAAVAAGMKRVHNVILDNWPVAFWLAEGAQHYVQSPSAYFGYRTMSGFTVDDRVLRPIPSDAIHQVGHFIDHELVSNIGQDCAARLSRASSGEPRRFLLSMGGAGAQRELFKAVIERLMPHIKEDRAALFVNLGDHHDHLDWLLEQLSQHRDSFRIHRTWEGTRELVESIRSGIATGIHVFCYENIFHAVYATNYLMRVSDILITKPSELAFYPIPKIFTMRIGGHEAWGAIRSSEIGDGTTEARTLAHALNAIDLMIEDDDLLAMFCNSIVKNKGSGIYDGAYEVCKKAQ